MLKCTLLQMSSNYGSRIQHPTLCLFIIKYKVEFYTVVTQKRFSLGLKFLRETSWGHEGLGLDPIVLVGMEE